MDGPRCSWCGVDEEHARPEQHTVDGRRRFLEDALARSRKDGRRRYPEFSDRLRREQQFRWSYDSRGRMVL